MATSAYLQDKVEKLLNLLNEVEECIITDSFPLNSSDGKKLADRLCEVADLVDRKCNSIEILDESEGEEYDSVEHDGAAPTPPVANSAQQQSVKQEQPIKHEGSTPSIPPQQSTGHVQQPGSSVPSMYSRFGNRQPEVLDEPARKRRREAEAMVQRLQRPKTFSCGISYQGDEKEREFSEGIKEDLRHHLPALKNHRHIFHYMAWATRERLECPHCRKCTSEYP